MPHAVLKTIFFPHRVSDDTLKDDSAYDNTKSHCLYMFFPKHEKPLFELFDQSDRVSYQLLQMRFLCLYRALSSCQQLCCRADSMSDTQKERDQPQDFLFQ